MITKRLHYMGPGDECCLTAELCKMNGDCHECETAYEQEQINAIVKSVEQEITPMKHLCDSCEKGGTPNCFRTFAYPYPVYGCYDYLESTKTKEENQGE